MKRELDREDLINLVNGTSPSYGAMGNKLIDRCGKYWDVGGWKWNEYELKELTDSELYNIYLTCKKSQTEYTTKARRMQKDAEAKEESEWISVNDRIPEETYFISNNIKFKTLSGKIINGFTKKHTFYNLEGQIIDNVTYWKPKNK